MKSKHIDDITVTSFCEYADIPRKTFYRYFDSKEDAVRGFIEHSFSEFYSIADRLATSSEKRSILREFEIYFIFWQSKSEVLRVLERSGLLGMLRDSSITISVEDRISTARFLPNDNESERGLVFRFAIAGIYQIMIEWYKSGFKKSTRDMAVITSRLLPGAP